MNSYKLYSTQYHQIKNNIDYWTRMNLTDKDLYTHLKKSIDKLFLQALSLETAKWLVESQDVKAGKKLLKHHFCMILSLNNNKGENLIQHLLVNWKEQFKVYSAVREIDRLLNLLYALRSNYSLEKKKQCEEIISWLSPLARDFLFSHYWKKTPPQNREFETYPLLLLESAKDSLLALEKSQENLSLSPFIATSIRQPQILPSNDPQTVQTIDRIYQLEDFLRLLKDPSQDNQALLEAWHNLRENCKSLTVTLATLVSGYRFDHFNEETIKQDLRIFLKMQNEERVTILEQLLALLQIKGWDDEQLFSCLRKPFPKDPMDVSCRHLTEELPSDFQRIFITSECWPLSFSGGLGLAVWGMVMAAGAQYCRVIMPLYRNGPIREEFLEKMRLTKKSFPVDRTTSCIYKITLEGVRYYLVDHYLFGALNKMYGDENQDYHLERHKWAVFQRVATDLSYLFSKKKDPVKLVHLNDAPTFLIPEMMATLYPKEYFDGKTPVMIATVHNNGVPITYDDEKAQSYLKLVGLEKRSRNSIIEASLSADIFTTVSETFAKEMQKTEYGQGVHHNKGTATYMRRAAFEGKFFGMVYGSFNKWDPRTDKVLETLNLQVSPEMDPLIFAHKLKLAKELLCLRLKNFPINDPRFAVLDPQLPIFLYIGRYDSYQKGMEELLLIMQQVLEQGGQIIYLGTGTDPQAKKTLQKMQKMGKEREGKGVLILEDLPDYCYQNEDGLAVLMRLACSLCIFPSIFEPLGLVKKEAECFGKMTIVTNTGGFRDTAITKGPAKNSYLFPSIKEVDRKEQERVLSQVISLALEEERKALEMLYSTSEEKIAQVVKRQQIIMKNALESTWTTVPKKIWVEVAPDQWEEQENRALTPNQELNRVYREGFRRREKFRGGVIIAHLNIARKN